jgi:hypothetical protein
MARRSGWDVGAPHFPDILDRAGLAAESPKGILMSIVRVKKLNEAGIGEAMHGMAMSHGLHKRNMSEDERWGRKLTRANKLATMQGGHNKFLESMIMWLEVKAPRYWWQQADTYRISTKQSESTMHTILAQPLTQCDFAEPIPDSWLTDLNQAIVEKDLVRVKRWLPEGFLQARVWMMSYKTLQNIWLQRQAHKLTEEWGDFLNGTLNQLDHPSYVTGK